MKQFAVLMGGLLLLSGCTATTPEPTAPPVGSWRGVAVQDTTGMREVSEKVTLLFDGKDNRLSGYDGCNQLMGTITWGADNKVGFSQVGNTKKRCEPNPTPANFYSLLGSVSHYDYASGLLILSDAQGAPLMHLDPVEASSSK